MLRYLVCIFALAQTTPFFVSAQTACNGYAALCNRSYSNVTEIGTHDSAFVGSLPTDNQDINVTAQLDQGIRFLQAQTHLDILGSLTLCHTSCLELDAGPVEAYLVTVKEWLDANPNEVLTMLLTNGDNVNVSMFADAFSASGIQDYAFVPASSPDTLAFDAWPTLQELITAGTRLVMFLGLSSSSLLLNLHLTPWRRLWRRHIVGSVYTRRILLLFRDPIRHYRPYLRRMHS